MFAADCLNEPTPPPRLHVPCRPSGRDDDDRTSSRRSAQQRQPWSPPPAPSPARTSPPTYRHRHAECGAGQCVDKPPSNDFALTLRITRKCRTIAARPKLSAVVATNGWYQDFRAPFGITAIAAT